MTEQERTELDAELEEIYNGWQDSEDLLPGLFRAIYDYGRKEERRLSASIADTAKPVIDKSMVKRLMVQYGLDKSHESIADTAGASDKPVSAFQTLQSALQADASYAWGWHCNLAMPIMDSIRCTPVQANKAAADLMQYLFEIDVRKFPEWHHDEPAPPAPSVADAAGASEDAQDAARWRHLRNCGVIVDFTHAGPWKFTDDVDAAVDKLMARSAAINAARGSKTTERKKLCKGSHIMCEGREYCLAYPSCSGLEAKESGND